MNLRSFSWSALFVVSTITAGNCYAADISVEDLTLSKKYTETWGVTGKIRNNESSAIRGYVKIKFIDGANDITKTASAYVNGNDPVGPGQAAPFEYWTESTDFKGVENFQVIFIESHR